MFGDELPPKPTAPRLLILKRSVSVPAAVAVFTTNCPPDVPSNSPFKLTIGTDVFEFVGKWFIFIVGSFGPSRPPASPTVTALNVGLVDIAEGIIGLPVKSAYFPLNFALWSEYGFLDVILYILTFS